MPKKRSLWVMCSNCGHAGKNHKVLYETVRTFLEDEDGPPLYDEYHRLVECIGCGRIKYIISTITLQNGEESGYTIYPGTPRNILGRTAAISRNEATDDGEKLIPDPVWKMYEETIAALNANIRTLAGGGLRAMVEAICLDKGIKGNGLQSKIDELVRLNFLTASQAELLHEERYLGNAALHEMETPSSQDLDDGLSIVEGLINAIYILPTKAKRLKARREARKRPPKRTITSPKPDTPHV